MATLPSWVSWLSIILSISSFLMAGYALYLNHQRTSITMKEYKEKMIQQKKAFINCIIIKGRPEELVISNTGHSKATNIRTAVYKYDPKTSKDVPIDLEVNNKVLELSPSEDYKELVAPLYPDHLPWNIMITWDDEYQKNNEMEKTIQSVT